MAQEILLTSAGLKELEAELEDLRVRGRQEIKEKIDEYDKNKVQVGDVVTTVNGSAEYLVLRAENNPKQILHVCNVANGTVQTLTCEVKKTGKHIDIQSVLDQIGGGNHD